MKAHGPANRILQPAHPGRSRFGIYCAARTIGDTPTGTAQSGGEPDEGRRPAPLGRVRGEGRALALRPVQGRGPSPRTKQRGGRCSHYSALRSKVASSCQKNDFKQADATASHVSHAATGSGKAAEQHASQHPSHDSAGHTPHEPAASLLLNGTGRRRILLP